MPAAPAPTTVDVVSTSNPSLNGTFSITTDIQMKLQAVALYIMVNGKFPANQAALPWMDVTGNPHVFATTASFQAFASAIGDYVTALDLGGSPTTPITIP